MQLSQWLDVVAYQFQKVPGSAVLIRYVSASYQDDPVRSAVELILVIFFIRYLLSPSYSTSKQNFIKLSEDVRKSRAAPFSASRDERAAVGGEGNVWLTQCARRVGNR